MESTEAQMPVVATSNDVVRYEVACNRLANEAVRRLSADNVTVLLIAIRH